MTTYLWRQWAVEGDQKPLHVEWRTYRQPLGLRQSLCGKTRKMSLEPGAKGCVWTVAAAKGAGELYQQLAQPVAAGPKQSRILAPSPAGQ